MNYGDEISEETWKRWEKKRRNTVFGYILVATMIGLDYSFMFTTLYLYLRDMVKTSRPDLYYGIMIGVYSLSSTLFGVVSGRWVDKTRKIKLYSLITLLLQIIGCCLYIIHFNIAYPLIGRAIGGLGDPFPSVVSGEVVRIYDKKTGTRVLFWLASVYSVAFMCGPLLAMIFKGFDFYIGHLHLTQLNLVAVLMAALLIVTFFISIFLIQDCSAEIDYKEYLKRQNEDEETREKRTQSVIANGGEEPHIQIPMTTIFKNLLRNTDSALMFFSTFIFMYCLFSADVLLSVVTFNLLSWNLNALTALFVVEGIIYFATLLVMSKYCSTDKKVYAMTIVSIVSIVFMFSTLILMKLFARVLWRDIFFMSLFILAYSTGWIVEEVMVRSMLAKMVPSSCQSFAESLRNGVSRTSTVLASVTSPLVMAALHWWSGGLVVIIFILLIVFLARRKTLSNIKEINFEMDEKSPSNVVEPEADEADKSVVCNELAVIEEREV